MNDLIQIVKEPDKWTKTPPPGQQFQMTVLAWIERDGGSADPWTLARLAVPRLAELVEADQVSAEYWTHKHRRFLRPAREELTSSQNWFDLMSRGDAELEKDAEFPHRIAFQRDGMIVLLARAEFWNMVGGPMPYHDSVALSFFAGTDLRSELEAIFLEACRSLGIERKTL